MKFLIIIIFLLFSIVTQGQVLKMKEVVTAEGDTIQIFENKTWKFKTSASAVRDIDGNLYSTIKIGDQVWMNENLRTTKLNNGSFIANRTDNTEWKTKQSPAYSAYGNDNANALTVGYIYNQYSIVEPCLCPMGWRVPTKEDYSKLFGNSASNNSGFGTWKNPGIVKLIGGSRSYDGTFRNFGNSIWFGTNSTGTTGNIFALSYSYQFEMFQFFSYDGTNPPNNKNAGYYVRCIRNERLNPPFDNP
jgi:uncharacterized protein (TIGR02145 family)